MSESALKFAPGYFAVDWGAVELSGPDSRDFLNRLSTLDFRKPLESVRLGAFLTGKSGVVLLGFFRQEGQTFQFLVPKAQVADALEHIEKFHFAEDMKVEDVSAHWKFFVQGAGEKLAEGVHWADPWISGLTWTQSPAKAPEPTGPRRENALLEFAWVQQGAPTVGRDIDPTVMLLEADLERAVDRNKGCYPGQEVVERIFTYGQVNRKLKPVTIEGPWRQASLPLKFMREGKPAAFLVSGQTDPENPSVAVGLAFIYRYFWDVSEPFEEAGVRIRILKNA